jgi:hypothetical protein
MIWITLVIVVIAGGVQSVPMQTKDGCEKAAERINADGRRYGVGFYAYCVEQN